MDYHQLTNKVQDILWDTAAFIKAERNKWDTSDLVHKSDHSLVTSIDKGVEERLVNEFSRLLPTSTFLAEENYNMEEESDLTWIIDPIDGTTNLVHNVPMYCMSIALREEEKTVMGFIYEISSGECFWAHEGLEGAFLNEKRIGISRTERLQDSLLATGFPVSAFRDIDEYLQHFKEFIQHTRGIRRLGSAAMDLAYVACGRFDGFFEYNLSPWDVAAGAYLVEKAGGKVTDFKGGKDFLFGRQMLASNSLIHQEFLNQFNKRKD